MTSKLTISVVMWHCVSLAADLPHSQVGRTALIWAAHNGQVNCVRLLMNGGADKNAQDKVRVRVHAQSQTCSYSAVCVFRRNAFEFDDIECLFLALAMVFVVIAYFNLLAHFRCPGLYIYVIDILNCRGWECLFVCNYVQK